MNSMNKLYNIFLTLVVLLSSCNLGVDLREKETEDIFIKSDTNVDKLWINLYSSFSYNGGWLDCATDNGDYNPPGGLKTINEGTWNQFKNELDGNGTDWKRMYALLRDAAYFLRITDTNVNPRFDYEEYNVPYDKGMMTDYYQKRFNLRSYRNDARFFQAYLTFELWKRYGKIPIVDKEYTLEETKQLKQAETKEVMEYITSKLDGVLSELDSLQVFDGKGYYKSPYKNNEWETKYYGRINKGIVLALKTRAYLYAASPLNAPNPSGNGYDQAYCDKAAIAAAELMSMGLYSSSSGYYDIQFNYTKEDILSISYSGNGYERNNYPRIDNNLLYNSAEVCKNAFCPSQNLVDCYSDTPIDFSKDNPYQNIEDLRFYQTVIYNNQMFNGDTIKIYKGGTAEKGTPNATTTGYYLKKGVRENLNLYANNTSTHLNYIFRFGEILLNYAEASLNGTRNGGAYPGTSLSALEAVNLLRARLDKTGGKPVNKPLIELNNERIRKERRIELAFEGHYFWDVRRWKIGGTQNDDLMGLDIEKTNNRFKYSRVKIESRKFFDPMYHYPIPYIDRRLYPDWDFMGW